MITKAVSIIAAGLTLVAAQCDNPAPQCTPLIVIGYDWSNVTGQWTDYNGNVIGYSVGPIRFDTIIWPTQTCALAHPRAHWLP